MAFSTKIKGSQHLQGNVQVYMIAILHPASRYRPCFSYKTHTCVIEGGRSASSSKGLFLSGAMRNALLFGKVPFFRAPKCHFLCKWRSLLFLLVPFKPTSEGFPARGRRRVAGASRGISRRGDTTGTASLQLGGKTCGCGSKLTRRGKPQVLVRVSTNTGSILVPGF